MSSSDETTSELLRDYASIRGLALALVSDRGLAEEVAQEAIVQRLSKGEPQVRSRPAWLAGLVRNVAAGLTRRETRIGIRERLRARPVDVPSTTDILEREESRRVVVEALLRVKEPMRSTLVLRYLEGLTPRVVAQRLGIPAETVRTRTKRGLERLRAELEKTLGDAHGWVPALVPHLLAGSGKGAGAGSAPLLGTPTGILAMSMKKATVLLLCFLPMAAWVASRALGDRPTEDTELALSKEGEFEKKAATRPAVFDPGQRMVAGETDPADRQGSLVDGPALASLELQLTHQPAGLPAGNVQVHWAQEGLSWFVRSASVDHTDSEGTLILEDIQPGILGLALPNLHTASVELAPGEHRRLHLDLVQGLQLSGRVVDGNGTPVPAACVLVQASNPPSKQRLVVARTDLHGRYSVPSLLSQSGPQVSVEAMEFGPTPQIEVSGDPGEAVELDFVLREPGSPLAGRVVDIAGQPVPGALVLIGGSPPFTAAISEDGRFAQPAAPQRCFADDQGKFAVDGVAAGEVWIRAHAPGFGPVSFHAPVTLGVQAQVLVRLEGASKLAGLVTDALGAPKTGLEVIAGGIGVMGRRATTDSEGRYLLEDLPVGEFQVEMRANGYLPVRATVVGLPGRTLDLHTQLDRGAELSGRLECQGEAVPGFQVQALWKRVGTRFLDDSERVTTAADGSFTLHGIERKGSLRVAAYDPQSGKQVAVQTGIVPDGSLVLLELPPELLSVPSVFLEGRVVGLDGTPNSQASFFLGGPGTSGVESTVEPDGTLRAGPFPPGEFNLFIDCQGLAHQRLASPTLAAGETFDYGDIVVSPGGKLEVRFLRGEGAPVGAPNLSLFAGNRSVGMEILNDHAVSQPAVPGEYSFLLRGSPDLPIASLRRTLTIREGERTRIEIPLVRGYVHRVKARYTGTPPAEDSVGLSFLDAEGVEVARSRSWSKGGEATHTCEVVLAEGPYLVVLETEQGWSAETRIRVGPQDPTDSPIVTLQRP